MNNCYCCSTNRIEGLLRQLRTELAEALFKSEIKDEVLTYNQYLPSNKDGYITRLNVTLRPVKRDELYVTQQGPTWSE
jgi:hypothetical protein